MPKKKQADEPGDLITYKDAADLRGYADSSAISRLVARGHLRKFEKYGKPLVSKAEVKAYRPGKPGPKPKGGA